MNRSTGWYRIKYEEDEYYEDDFVFAEHSFLDIYNLNFTQGNPSTALTGSNELIINTTTAKKYFGEDDPIGKRINLNGFRDLEVIGVFEDLPDNTHLQLTLILTPYTRRKINSVRRFNIFPSLLFSSLAWDYWDFHHLPQKAEKRKSESGK